MEAERETAIVLEDDDEDDDEDDTPLQMQQFFNLTIQNPKHPLKEKKVAGRREGPQERELLSSAVQERFYSEKNREF